MELDIWPLLSASEIVGKIWPEVGQVQEVVTTVLG